VKQEEIRKGKSFRGGDNRLLLYVLSLEKKQRGTFRGNLAVGKETQFPGSSEVYYKTVHLSLELKREPIRKGVY